MKKVNYLIVGQGIAGTILALELIKAGKTVCILNKESSNTSSNKAAGLYNPITGRKMVKTWLADELFASLEIYYRSIEKLLEADFLDSRPIYRPFFSYEEQNDWQGKASLAEYQTFIKQIHIHSLGIAGVIDPFGGIEINHCGSVNLPEMIVAARKYFIHLNSYIHEEVDYEQIIEQADGIQYRDIKAEMVIFCEGPSAVNNPLTSALPFKLVKGEIIDIESKMDPGRIVNRGVFMVPRNGSFKIGATYDHSELNDIPTDIGRANIESRLKKIYADDYNIIGHVAGVRPATFDRKPLIGLTGSHQRIGVFNGLGAKGVSLTPFFATQFVNYLLGKGNMIQEVRLDRGK